MDRLLARLERKLGRFAIPNFTYLLVGGMAIAWALSLVRPSFIGALHLDLDAVRHGQVWRLLSFLFIPPDSRPLWIFFSLYWTWMVGTNLENEWGAFKLNLYYGLGTLFTVVVAALVGPSGNTWLNLSLFLAFATLFPDFEMRIFFILPVRMKWVGILIGVGLAIGLVLGSWPTRGAILAGVANYLLFFAGHFADLARGRKLLVQQAARRSGFSVPPKAQAPKKGRVCAICGASEGEDDADIRVCSCEKCGGKPRNLCLPHARNH